MKTYDLACLLYTNVKIAEYTSSQTFVKKNGIKIEVWRYLSVVKPVEENAAVLMRKKVTEMKIWYLYYNENEKRIDYKEDELPIIAAEQDFPSNIDEEQHQAFTREQDAIAAADAANEELKTDELHIRKCKDCGIYYYTTWREEAWFESLNLLMPKRCKKCRRKRRDAHTKEGN